MAKTKLSVLVLLIGWRPADWVRAQVPERAPAWFAHAVGEKFSTNRAYAYEASVEFARKAPDRETEVAARFRVQWASAPGGKRLLRISGENGLQYVIVSDGRRTLAYVPAMKQYVEVAGSWPGGGMDPDVVFSRGPDTREPDSMLAADLVIPILARVSNGASVVEMNRLADDESQRTIRQLPILTVLSEGREQGQSMTAVALDPETLEIASLEWKTAVRTGEDQKSMVLLTAKFDSVRTGGDVPGETFALRPPENAVRVAELPLPGLCGDFIRKMTAPDFELRQAGRANQLASLNGGAALVIFLADDSETARQQLATAAPVAAEYKGKLTVVAVGPVSETRAGAATASDSAGTIRQQYGVKISPTVVIVDPSGKVAAFLPGAQDAAALRTALKAANL